MSQIRFVHHIQFACSDLWSAYRSFTKGFGFKFHSFFKHGNQVSLSIENGRCKLLLNPTTEPALYWRIPPSEFTEHFTTAFSDRTVPFDVAFEVEDVHAVCSRLSRSQDSDCVIVDPVVYSDYHGKVTMAVIKSCIGNVYHTLLDTSQYRGLLLPGFMLPELGAASGLSRKLDEYAVHGADPPPKIAYLDHIALACHTGESTKVTKWYESVFGMKRIAANIHDDPSKGFRVQYGSTGMNLRAAAYDVEPTACTFVFVEPTENSAPNQVTRYLDANGGPGIQHLAFAVDDIFSTIESCKRMGAQFINPPPAYYSAIPQSLLGRLSVKPQKLNQSGVLVDSTIASDQSNLENEGILFQIFTPPLFERDAFFVELIQRYNSASGFGARNITALWRAVEDSMQVEQHTQSKIGRSTT